MKKWLNKVVVRVLGIFFGSFFGEVIGKLRFRDSFGYLLAPELDFKHLTVFAFLNN